MFGTTLDILYFVLAIVIALFGILGSVGLLFLVFILRDLSRTTHNIEEITDKINNFLYQPLKIMLAVADKVKPIIEAIHDKAEESAKCKKKNKK